MRAFKVAPPDDAYLSASSLEAEAPPIIIGLDEVLQETSGRLREIGYSALAFIRPDTLCPQAGSRILERASMPALLSHKGMLEEGFRAQGPDYAFEVALNAGQDPWTVVLRGLGFGTAQILRIPVSNDHFYEFVALSMSSALRESSAHAAVFMMISSWPKWRIAIQHDLCPLSGRERDSLRAAAAGLNGAAAAQVLGCTERTFRLHTENAKRKMASSSVAEAIYKASLICGL